MIPNKNYKKNPPNNPSRVTISTATIQVVSENPEHWFLGQDIYRKEISNTRKKRTPSPTYSPSNLFPTITDSSEKLHSVSVSNIDASAAPELLLNEGFSNSPLRFISEGPILQPARPRPQFATLHSPISARQHQVNCYSNSPSSTRYSPPGHSPPSYISEAPPSRPRPRFATLHNVTAITPQYLDNGYLKSAPHACNNRPGYSHPSYISASPPERHLARFAIPYNPAVESQYVSYNYPSNSRYSPYGYSHPSYMSKAPILLPESHLPQSSTPYNPAVNASQYASNNHPSDASHSPYRYSHSGYLTEASISLSERPRACFSAPSNPVADTRQHSVNICLSNPSNISHSSPINISPAPTSPPRRPCPRFATLQSPAAATFEHNSNSYPNCPDNMVGHEPILRRQSKAPNVDNVITMSHQTIGAKWVRSQCARRMAFKLNEIEERHAENAKRFTALMKSLDEHALTDSRGNDQPGAVPADAKLASSYLITNDYQVTNTPPAPEVPAPHLASTSKPLPHSEFEDTTHDEGNIQNENYSTAPCNIT